MSKVIKSGKLDNVIASMDAEKHYIVKMRDGTVTAIEKTGLPEKIRVCLGNGCFIAGTLVTTRSGLKPIEEIVIGDYVLSINEETGENSYKKITDTLVRSTQEICTIELENGNIKSTTGHLFMVKDKWWKAAVELIVGDILVTSDGKEQVVKSIKVEEKGYPVTTYNLTIEDNHTFFVNNEGVLTHNMNNVLKECNFVTETSEKFTSDVKTYCKKNNIEITSELDAFLDKVQVALDLAGWLPIVGDVADGINAAISLCRGNYLEALICVVAMLPLGDMLKSLKYADEAKGILKYGDEFLKGVKTVAKEGSEKLSKQMSKVIKSGKLDNVIASMDAGKHYIVKMRDGTVTAIEKTGLPEKIGMCLGNGCFIAGTLVTTRLGLKPIEEIVIGDYVLSRFEGLQVKPYWEDGMNFAEYRSKMMAYEIIEPIDAAFGITKANHQFGSGGLPQMFIPNFKELLSNGKIKKVELKAVKLSNYKMELKVMMNG